MTGVDADPRQGTPRKARDETLTMRLERPENVRKYGSEFE